MPSRRPPPPAEHNLINHGSMPPIRRPPPLRHNVQDRDNPRHLMLPSRSPPPLLMPPPLSSPMGHYGDDRISELPDRILVSIISHLPVRTLLSTSFLSRRWRALWTHATRLDFDLCRDPYQDPTPPVQILDRVLSAHQPSTLPVCRIRDHSIGSSTARNLHRLIPILTLKRIAKLSLDYHCWGHKYNPYEILTIPTLQHLSISHYSSFKRRLPRPDSIRLRSLQLNNTKLKDAALSIIISSAPLLDCLSLIHCDLLEHPHITSQTLTQLEIGYAPLLNSLNIHTPALTTLTLNDIPYLTDVIVNAPSLSILNTSTYYIGEEDDHVWRSPSNNTVMLHTLLKRPDEVLRNGEVFAKLSKLFISTNLSCCVDAAKLATVLHNCNNLRELGVINTAFLNWNWSSPSTFWEMKDPIFSLEHRMEYLWVRGFTGSSLELDFVVFIVVNCLGLKQVMISSYESDTLEAVESVLLEEATDLDIDLDIITIHDK